MNTLTIKNFGPIKDISLNLKKVNLLIGTQGSGKSTIAKILSIMNDPELVMADTLDKFLVDYNINYDISEKTFMEYKTPEFNVTIESNQIKHSLKKTLNDEELRKFVLSKLKISINDINKWFNTPKESLKSESNEIEQDLINKGFEITSDKIEDTQEYIKFVFNYPIIQLASTLFLESCIYIPSERNFFALLAENIFGLLAENIISSGKKDMTVLPKCILKFGRYFEQAIKSIKKDDAVDIPFIEELKFIRREGRNEIIYKGVSNSLTQGSSGFQSSIPLAIVCLQNKNSDRSLFIIEEPEQNLYPVTQYNMVKFLAENCLNQNNKLLITTHSPYILTSFVNLIQAHSSGAIHPKLTAKLIPKTQWIDFNDVSAYFIDKGSAKDILDYEEKTIFAEEIDNASSDIANEYNQLLEIAYRNR